MSMVVRSNINSMNANRNLSKNNSMVAKSIEKLASGYAINRAADDAAGLAVSEKMRAQITGIDQGTSNSLEGINLVQTAEGALNEIHEMLNRISELCVKSSNGTIMDEVDREAIQIEVDVLLEEIDRIAQATTYNGIMLLNGLQEIVSTELHINGILSEMYTNSDAFLTVSSSVASKYYAEYDTPSVSLSDSVSLVSGATSIPSTGPFPYVISTDIYVYNETTSTEESGSDITIYTVSVTANDGGTITASYQTDDGTYVSVDYTNKTYQTAFDVANGNVGYEYVSDFDANGVTASELQVIMCELLSELGSETGTDLCAGGSLGLTIPNDSDLYTYNTYNQKMLDENNLVYMIDSETGELMLDPDTNEPIIDLVNSGYVVDYSKPTTNKSQYPVFDTGSTDPIYPVDTESYTNSYNGVTSTIDDIGNYISAEGNFGLVSSVQVLEFYIYNDPANDPDADRTYNTLTKVIAPNLSDYDSYDDYVQDVNNYYETYGIESDDYINETLTVTDSYGNGMRIFGSTAAYTNTGRTLGVVSSVTAGTAQTESKTNPTSFDTTISAGYNVNGLDPATVLGFTQLGESIRSETQIPEPIDYSEIVEIIKRMQDAENYQDRKSILSELVASNVITITKTTVDYPDTFTDELTEEQVLEQEESTTEYNYITVAGASSANVSSLEALFMDYLGLEVNVVTVAGVTNPVDYHYIIDELANQISEDFDGIRATRMVDDVANDVPTDSNETRRYVIQLGSYVQDSYEWDREPEDKTFNDEIDNNLFIQLADEYVSYNHLYINIGDMRIADVELYDLEGLTELYDVFNSGVFEALTNGVTTLGENFNVTSVYDVYDLYISGDLDGYSDPNQILDKLSVLEHYYQEGGGLSILKDLDVSTQESAGLAVDLVKMGINYVSTNRASLGAYQNRLEYTINVNNNTSENLVSARSVIKDTDMASEMMQYTKMDILVQSAQAMLAQSNAASEQILSLLG